MWYRRLSLLHPPLLSVKMAYRNPKIDLTRGVSQQKALGKSNGGFSEGGFPINRSVLKPDVAIASEVSILSKNSLAITDFHAKKTQHIQLFE